MKRAEFPLYADRNVPFLWDIQIVGESMPECDVRFAVRAYGDAPGVPLLDLQPNMSGQGLQRIYAGTDTVANLVTAGHLDDVPDGKRASDTIALTVIRIYATTVQDFPLPPERGGPFVGKWDMWGKKLPADIWQVWFAGDFIVRAGVKA